MNAETVRQTSDQVMLKMKRQSRPQIYDFFRIAVKTVVGKLSSRSEVRILLGSPAKSTQNPTNLIYKFVGFCFNPENEQKSEPTQFYQMGHRGKHSNDDDNFHTRRRQALLDASIDLSYLLERGYGDKSALQLVGNRYSLNVRQQSALGRVAVAASAVAQRLKTQITAAQLAQQPLSIDGYNLLIGVEVALSKGYLFHCQDGCYRDIASIHGTYRKVEETLPAIALIGQVLHKELKVGAVTWFFDSPVSNSGQLKTLLYEHATAQGYDWTIELVHNPDKTLVETRLDTVIISSDGWVIDRATRWANLLGFIVDNFVETPELIKF